MSGETNPYRELIVNNAEKIEPLMTEMEQWSFLSNILNFIQHDRHHMINHNLGIRAVKNIGMAQKQKGKEKSQN